MNYKLSLLVLGLVLKVYSAKFSVVSFEGNCQVSINGQNYEMKQENADVPLYTASVDVPVNTKYNYICNGTSDVERTLTEENTHNELIGRAITIYDMPEFGYPNAEPWTRSIGRTELFDSDYVPIVIVDDDKQFFTGATQGTTFKKMTFILKDNVFTFNNVGAGGKNYDEDKFQFKITLPNGGIYNRDVLKFRPSSYDPVFFRQMLYGDIAHAVGNPAHESIASRVYLSDGTPIGLYVLQEDCTTESFIRTAFYGDEKTGEVKDYKSGPIYDCATGADFSNDDPNDLGGFINRKDESDPKIELVELNTKIAELDVTNDEAVKYLDDNWLDLDTLFRALALEYLAGHWDSYWFLTTNFVTYHPPEEEEGPQYQHTKYKYYFIDQDFDQTWGSNMKASLQADKYPTIPYTEYINKDAAYWKNINSDEPFDWGSRVILNKFIGCDGQPTCSTKELFESHLKSIVQHVFNPVAIKRKTDGYKARLSEEIKWDTSLTRLFKSQGGIYHFTYDDFETNIERGVGAFPYGILDWTTQMADNVCKQFGIKYDEVAYTPETAAEQKTKPINPGENFDPESNLNNSGSFATFTTNLFVVAIVCVLSSIYLL